MKKYLTLLFAQLCILGHSQCPIITVTPTLALTSCTGLGQPLTATSNYTSNVISWWKAPTNTPLASLGTTTSTTTINHIGTYTVYFKDVVSTCVTASQVVVTSNFGKPTCDIIASTFTPCLGNTSTISIVNGNTSPPGGAVTYTILAPGMSTTLPTGTLMSTGVYSINNCGGYHLIVKDIVLGCVSSFDVAIACSTVLASPVTISGANTVCAGSSFNFTASGASSYTWTGPFGIVNSSVNSFVIANTPTSTWNISLQSIDANGCYGVIPFSAIANTNCAVVWPGDADRDGAVTTSDVLELGLWASSTGPARTATSVAWAGQFANAWTGTTSTGWNSVHADCNGDGVVNTTDNAAITANFSFTHAFKSSQTSASPDIKLVPQYNVAYGGVWNKADVVLGDVATPINVYGTAFDINYDQALIQTDSVKLVYVPSFLKLNTTTIDFEKRNYTSGKMYAATVRTNQLDVIGTGKIAEFWYKIKSGLPQNTTLNLSVSNGLSVLKSGVKSTLATQTPLTLQVDNNALGLSELRSMGAIRVYPNPASGYVTLSAKNGVGVNYTISDITGRRIVSGDFVNTVLLNLSELADGIYLITLESNGEREDFKLTLQK